MQDLNRARIVVSTTCSTTILESLALNIPTVAFFDADSDRFLFPSIFIRTLGSTVYYTLVTMILCLIVGYPIAYFLALQVQTFKWQLALFLLCMVPFWTSYLIRAVAWLPMLGRRGLINQALTGLGIVDKPVSFLFYSEFGYTMALVQIYVVLCIGPIFFSLAKIDKSFLEAGNLWPNVRTGRRHWDDFHIRHDHG